MTDKLCSKCGVTKPSAGFSTDSDAVDGLQHWCKACRKEYDREYRATGRRADYGSRPEYKAKAAEYGRRPEVRARRNELKASPEGKARTRDSYARCAYGVTHDELLARQEGKCLICGVEFKSLSRRLWHIDHCHETGVVRGMLCQDCNTSLGKFGDSPAVLRKAADYLERFEVFK